MPEIDDRDRFHEFCKYAPPFDTEDRGSWLSWLQQDGDFDVAGAEEVQGDDDHLLLVWAEEHYSAYEVLVVPRAEVDFPMDRLHKNVFGFRAYNDLEADLVPHAINLVLRASFEPEAYFDGIGDIVSAARRRGITLPGVDALRAEVGRWRNYVADDGTALNRQVTALCAVRFTSWG